jgi:hypothetical protein
VIGAGLGLTWLQVRGARHPRRVWLRVDSETDDSIEAVESLSDHSNPARLLLGNDREVFETETRSGRVRGWLEALGMLDACDPAVYWGTTLRISERGCEWNEAVLDGDISKLRVDPNPMAGTWRHSAGPDTTWTMEFGASSLVDGAPGPEPWRWALEGDTIVCAPAPKIGVALNERIRRRLRGLESWSRRFQATIKSDGRSYVGRDGTGQEVVGVRLE